MSLWLYVKSLAKHWWALMSCAVFTGIGIAAAWLGKSNGWVVWVSCIAGSVLFVVASFLAWQVEHGTRVAAEGRLQDRRPKFIFNAGPTVWLYDKNVNKTVFFLAGGILNQGESSVALGWSAKYTIGDTSEPMKMFHLIGPYTVPVGNEHLTLMENDLLPTKAFTQQIARGDQKSGRILVTLEGDRTAQVRERNFAIEITCQDFLFTPYSTSFVPSAEPLDGLQFFPTENVKIMPSS